MSGRVSGRVVSVANAMVDVVARVPRPPARGGDVLATGGGAEVGGGGFRALAAAAAAGAETVFAGRIGTGPFADLVVAALDRHGIAVVPRPRVDRDQGVVLTLLEPDGERTFATVPGAEGADPALVQVALLPGDHVHVHGYGLVDPVRAGRIAAWIAAVPDDAVVLLDPGPFGADADPAALAPLLRRTDWWSGDLAEARAATDAPDAADAARILAGTVRRGAIVRLGADGCLLAQRGAAPEHLPAPRVVAVDTSGAGDTHVGTFLALLAGGEEPRAAAVAANRAAARFVSGSSRAEARRPPTAPPLP